MKAQRAVWLPVAIYLLATVAAPARAQFEEADTIPKFSVGITGELLFRGSRGEIPGTGTTVSLGGGPAIGARMEYRLTRTLGIGVAGSWSQPDERRESQAGRIISPEPITQIQVTGELMLKVKPNIPGYFILGGGARYMDPTSSDPNDYIHDTQSWTDPMGIVGAGVEIGSRRSRVFKIDFRLYLVSPSDQLNFETKSIETGFGLDLVFMFRI